MSLGILVSLWAVSAFVSQLTLLVLLIVLAVRELRRTKPEPAAPIWTPIDQPRPDAFDAQVSYASKLGVSNPASPLPPTIPLPAEVVDYCNEESEEFARDACKARARFHYDDSQNWDIVVLQLKKDDGE